MAQKDVESQPKNRRFIERQSVTVTLPAMHVPGPFQGFVNFVREQGVVGLAVGLVLGTQVKAMVDQTIESFVNPLIGLLLPGSGSLAGRAFELHAGGKTATFAYGAFLAELISFVTVAAIVYFAVKGLKLDKLDKKKE